jgi:hypothetical protein
MQMNMPPMWTSGGERCNQIESEPEETLSRFAFAISYVRASVARGRKQTGENKPVMVSRHKATGLADHLVVELVV